MKRIKYVFLSSEINCGTEEAPDIKQHFIPKDFPYSEEGLEAAKREAYNGEYEIYEDGKPDPSIPTAPRNLTAGEYVTVNGVLYKATENIPNGERIIVGQNAIKTTVEAQLYELMGG